MVKIRFSNNGKFDLQLIYLDAGKEKFTVRLRKNENKFRIVSWQEVFLMYRFSYFISSVTFSSFHVEYFSIPLME